MFGEYFRGTRRLLLALVFSFVEALLAVVDNLLNVEPLYESFASVMASFGGEPLDQGVTCVSATATAFQMIGTGDSNQDRRCNVQVWEETGRSVAGVDFVFGCTPVLRHEPWD